MPNQRFVHILACVLVLLSLAGCSGTPRLTDHSGVQHTPLAGEPGELVVVVFSSTDCPIANAMAPDIERASVETTEAGGRFYLVHARTCPTNEPPTPAGLAVDAGDRRSFAHAGEDVGATVTPEAFVLRIDENGGHTVLYQGSVNNLYGSVGNRRVNVTEHHLRDAIRSAAAGEAVDPSRRTPFGCFIERN